MNFCLAPAISGLCGQAVCLLAKLFPGLALTLLTQCSLQQAEYVLVKVLHGTCTAMWHMPAIISLA